MQMKTTEYWPSGYRHSRGSKTSRVRTALPIPAKPPANG